MISVVIPAMNEKETIGETVSEIRGVLTEIESEIIVVDDGSTDDTLNIAKSAGAVLISHPHNLGYGAAIKSGIRQAKFDTIVITDADGTYPNQLIPQLLEQYNLGFDMVVSERTGNHYFESVIKSPLRWILKVLVEFASGRKVPDPNSGLRVFSKEKSSQYFKFTSNTFSFTTSLTLAYMMNGLFVSYFPVPYYKRKGKSKVRLFRDTLRTLQYIIEAIIYFNPFKLFFFFSSVVVFSSFLSGLAALYYKLAIFYYVGIGLFLVSVVIFSLGLIAVLLKQIIFGDK